MADPIEIMARAIAEGMLYPPPPREARLDPLQPGRDIAGATLSALRDAGFVVVPLEPTEVMVSNGAAALDYPSVFMGGPSKQNQRAAERAYSAMIQAAKDGK